MARSIRLPANSLWRDRSFALFWLARTISVSGTAITTVVLPILVFRLTNSALATALLATFEAVPYLCFGLLAGALADRLDRRRMMVLSDALNTVLLGSIPVAAAFSALSLPLIYAVSLLSATAFVWFDAASFGALPALVGRERIVAANSAITTAGTIAAVAGPAVGGVLAATIGPALAISFDAASYAASALLLSRVPRSFALSSAASDASDKASGQESAVRRTLDDIHAGLTYLWHQRLVRALTLLVSGLSFSGGAVLGLLVVYAVRALGLAHTDARIGLLFTAGALGSLLASLLLPLLAKRYPAGRVVLAGISLNLLFLIGLALAPGFGVALALMLAWEMTYTVVTISGISLRQRVAADALQSRVNASARMVAWGGAPIGAAIGGAVAGLLPIRAAYLVMAVGVAASATIGWLSPVRRQDAGLLNETEPAASVPTMDR